ncbi:transposase [Photorhabdus khanii]|uniref:Transposase n=1 Tax=Photorhabdus khanii TaxID=1004150 RepID=A0A7C9GRW2_9GAMM|nr:transposase [Photorhabdus khanii]
MQVLNETARPAQSKSYMWVYRSGEFAVHPAVIFDYQPSRSGRCVADFLGDYAGYLLTDGYAAYDTLENVMHAGCMAHVQGKFTEAHTIQPGKKVGRAEQGLKLLVYLKDGHISLDNNVTERDIRPFMTGRKNRLFFTSAEGAFASANLYSLVMTCRANGINLYFYFRHIFTE